MEKFYYLGLMVFTLLYPLAQSFEHRIEYYKKWYALWPAIALTALVYVIWDHWFTVAGVWWFNSDYILGIYLFQLPLEEIMFFFVVPFACIFIYEVLIYFVKRDWFKPLGKPFIFFMIPLLLVLGFIHLDKLYTSFNFIFTAIVIFVHFLFFKDRFMGRFMMGYLVTLVPFLLVNGVLTGTWLDAPIVNYDNAENLSIRIGTVPIEDGVYLLGLLLLNISIYEKIKVGKTIRQVVSL
ncbi:MAG: lycopene cyclase domain-containing protein [Cyclobacteriaceae bacterium]